MHDGFAGIENKNKRCALHLVAFTSKSIKSPSSDCLSWMHHLCRKGQSTSVSAMEYALWKEGKTAAVEMRGYFPCERNIPGIQMRFLGPKSVISDVELGVVNPCLCEPLILMAYSVGIREPKESLRMDGSS